MVRYWEKTMDLVVGSARRVEADDADVARRRVVLVGARVVGRGGLGQREVVDVGVARVRRERRERGRALDAQRHEALVDRRLRLARLRLLRRRLLLRLLRRVAVVAVVVEVDAVDLGHREAQRLEARRALGRLARPRRLVDERGGAVAVERVLAGGDGAARAAASAAGPWTTR